MCFSVSVNIVREEFQNRYGADLIDPDKYRPSYYYHAFSFPKLPIICSDNVASVCLADWGLVPEWIKNDDEAADIRKKTVNARAETLSSKPAFKNSFESRRCLIPVTGFFEWQLEGNRKIPWYISLNGQKIFSIAGLWNDRTSSGGEMSRTFSLITVEANEIMSKIHNTKKRMPAILPADIENIWLKPSLSTKDAVQLLNPIADEVINAYTISSLINNSKANRNVADIIESYSYPSQGTLF